MPEEHNLIVYRKNQQLLMLIRKPDSENLQET